MAPRVLGLATALLALLAVSCGRYASLRAAHGQAPVVIEVQSDWDLETTRRVLADAAAGAGLRGLCGLVWGSVVPAPSFRLAVVELPEELVGWLACDPDLERAWAPCSEGVQSCNPLTRDGGLVGWHQGKLVGAHASDLSSLVEVDATRIPQDGLNYALVIGDQPRVPAAELLRALRSAGPGAIVLLPLDVPEPAPPGPSEYE
jgi:hypothetical protein